MNKFKQFAKRFVFGDEETPTSKREGKIHIVTPDGRVELTARFEDKEDFERIEAFISKENSILFSEKNF